LGSRPGRGRRHVVCRGEGLQPVVQQVSRGRHVRPLHAAHVERNHQRRMRLEAQLRVSEQRGLLSRRADLQVLAGGQRQWPAPLWIQRRRRLQEPRLVSRKRGKFQWQFRRRRFRRCGTRKRCCASSASGCPPVSRVAHEAAPLPHRTLSQRCAPRHAPHSPMPMKQDTNKPMKQKTHYFLPPVAA
jgi:hypothetical protein